MGFERIKPGLQYDSHPMVSIYTDGSARINVPADREWFEGYDRVAVYADAETGRLAFSPAPDDDTDTYALSRSDGKLGADVTTKSAVADLGLVDELDDTLNVALEKDDDLGLVVADVRAELDPDQDTDGDDAEDEDDGPEPSEPDGELDPVTVESNSETTVPSVPDQSEEDASDSAGGDGEVRTNVGAYLTRDDLDFLDPDDVVACAHCVEPDSVGLQGLKIHHGRVHKDLGDDGLLAEPVEISLPGSLTDGDVASVAEFYDDVDGVADDLEVTVPRACAILASRGLLEEVTGGA